MKYIIFIYNQYIIYMTKIDIFTDGSSLCNNLDESKRMGGIGVFSNIEKLNISEKLNGKVTNQIAELTACIKGIEQIKKHMTIEKIHINIYTDSMYVINSMTKWVHKWKNNQWKKINGKIIDNVELMKMLYEYCNKYNITFYHINSHTKKPKNENTKEYYLWYGNKMADEFAVKGAKLN